MIRNLILDWSGTLADDLACVLTATNGMLAHHGKAALSREEFRLQFRLPYTEFYEELLPGIEIEELKSLYLSCFPANPAAVALLPHVRQLLEHAAATGRRMFLLSSAPTEHVNSQAQANGVLDFFEAAYCGVIDKREAIHRMMDQYRLEPSETAFIGDMRHDIEAALGAGVLAVATATGYDSVELLMQSRPDMLVQDLSQLPRILGDLPISPAAGHGARHPLATVGALILDKEGRVLLLKTHKWSHRWGIPGGKIKRGETCEQALRREIREETGLELVHIRFVMVQDCVEPPEFERSAHFLLLNYLVRCEGSSPLVTLNDEAEEYQWLAWSDAVAQDLNIPTRVLIEEISLRGGPDLL